MHKNIVLVGLHILGLSVTEAMRVAPIVRIRGAIVRGFSPIIDMLSGLSLSPPFNFSPSNWDIILK
jgi:hypothetical protein